jgi:poly(A) polymerase
MLAWAQGKIADGAPLLAAASAWVAPVFPLRGADALALGAPAGPRVGEALRAVESWWEESDYSASRDACLQRLRALLVS